MAVLSFSPMVAPLLATALLASICWAPASPQEARGQATIPEAPFVAANDAAMEMMMKGMAIMPSGDVDRDFVAMMVPHHQGAIEMARALLRYGNNQQLQRIAQEIIITQQQEIAAMRLAVGQPLPALAPNWRSTPDPASAQTKPANQEP